VLSGVVLLCATTASFTKLINLWKYCSLIFTYFALGDATYMNLFLLRFTLILHFVIAFEFLHETSVIHFFTTRSSQKTCLTDVHHKEITFANMLMY
jgi:hypothetical protein